MIKLATEKYPYTQLKFVKFFYIVVLDVEIAIENAKLAMLELLALQIVVAPSQPRWRAD